MKSGKFFFCLVCFFSLAFFLMASAEEVAPSVVPNTPDVLDASVVSEAPASLEIPQPFQVEVSLIPPESSPADETSIPSVTSDADVVDAPQGNSDVVTSLSGASVTRDLQKSTDRVDGSVVAVLTSVLGEYTPATYQTVTYMDGVTVVTTELVPGLAGLDWPWLAAAGLFALMLLCLFKLLGGVWK